MSLARLKWGQLGTPLLNSSPAPLRKSDVRPLGLGRWNSAMARKFKPWSWVLALLPSFCGNCLWLNHQRNKGAWGPSYPRQTSRPDVPQKQLWFSATDHRKGNQTFLRSGILFKFAFKSYKLWLLYSVLSGTLGRQTKLNDFRADTGQETMALSVLSLDKWYLYTHPNLKRKCISLGFKHCNRNKAKIKACYKGKKMRSAGLVVLVQSLCCVRLFVTPWTVAHQASLSVGLYTYNLC